MVKLNREKPPIRLLIGIAIIVFGLYLLINGVLSLTDNNTKLIAPKGIISVEVVESDEDRALGLSGRESIADGDGMLFVFDELSNQNCFWMKDMQFAIDMIWLDDNKKVVSVSADVAPNTFPNSFCPDSAAKYGLEVGSFRAETLGIVVGESLRF